jgi:hypothetical protein
MSIRPSAQRFWPVLTFALLGCSALVDFEPLPRQQQPSPSAPGDGGAPSDASGQEAESSAPPAEAGAPPPEAGASCEPETHAGCSAAQLCCDRDDGRGARCFDTAGARECGACGEACSNPGAPHCGAGRVCECEQGSGKSCASGKRCLGTGAGARCAECETDDDCRSSSVGKQCVQNQCVECDRGAQASDAADDQGCNEAGKPICNERNACVACFTNPDNCPGDQVCNGSLGCFGCSLLTPLDTKSCGGTRPICRQGSGGQPQCDACRNNNECAPGYCDSRPSVGTGACTAACSPAGSLGANGCSAPTPFCQQIAGNEFGCRACAAADCSGATPYCATEAGSRRGFCVACRNNADCASNAGAPVCDTNVGTCRARQASDCTGGSVFDPATRTCLECVANTDCADTPATPVCASNRCVQCERDTECNAAAAPLCALVNNRCAACNTVVDADARCAAETPGTLCVGRGNRSGQCGVCEPGQNRGPGRGCPQATPFCFPNNNNNNNALVCHECDPNDDQQTCSNGNCRAMNGIYRCAVSDAGTATP